jgi:ADP-heptose:LPS heptosyltransferase
MQSIYQDSELIVVTHFPRLFQHLGCQVYNHEDWKGLDRTVLVMHTCPDDTQAKHPFSHVLFHPTDFASMSMYRMTIPNHQKTIKLEVETEDLETIESSLDSIEKPLVLVHPGKWWTSKTFPVEWWQRVIDSLAEHFTVGLIGKTISEEQGYLPVECPADGIDFRDSTTLGELIALISKAPVLLTNDSSPLHIAGAFDNWVMVVPTAKHPDHILPFRNGTQYYKTKSLCKKVLMQDLELRATEIDLDTINIVPEGKTIYDYLPDPETVVEEILEVFEPVKQKELCV